MCVYQLKGIRRFGRRGEWEFYCVSVTTLLVSPVYTTVDLHELTNPLETRCDLAKLLVHRLPQGMSRLQISGENGKILCKVMPSQFRFTLIQTPNPPPPSRHKKDLKKMTCYDSYFIHCSIFTVITFLRYGTITIRFLLFL